MRKVLHAILEGIVVSLVLALFVVSIPALGVELFFAIAAVSLPGVFMTLDRLLIRSIRRKTLPELQEMQERLLAEKADCLRFLEEHQSSSDADLQREYLQHQRRIEQIDVAYSFVRARIAELARPTYRTVA